MRSIQVLRSRRARAWCSTRGLRSIQSTTFLPSLPIPSIDSLAPHEALPSMAGLAECHAMQPQSPFMKSLTFSSTRFVAAPSCMTYQSQSKTTTSERLRDEVASIHSSASAGFTRVFSLSPPSFLPITAKMGIPETLAGA